MAVVFFQSGLTKTVAGPSIHRGAHAPRVRRWTPSSTAPLRAIAQGLPPANPDDARWRASSPTARARLGTRGARVLPKPLRPQLFLICSDRHAGDASRVRIRASVWECGSPLPLFPAGWDVRSQNPRLRQKTAALQDATAWREGRPLSSSRFPRWKFPSIQSQNNIAQSRKHSATCQKNIPKPQ